MKLNIGILFGGRSVEHDISIITALQIYENIDKAKYNVIPLYLNHQNEIYTGSKYFKLDTYKNKVIDSPNMIVLYKGVHYLQSIKKKFKKRAKIDVILNAVHGKGVEDGTTAGFLEFLGIPYTSSSILASAISQDKDFTKQILRQINIPVLKNIVISDDNKINIYQIVRKLKYPQIVKPAHLGSSIGIKKVTNQDQLIDAVHKALVYDNKVIIEPYLENFVEYNVAVYRRKTKLITSKIEVIKKEHEILDFDDKYISHHKDTKHEILNDQSLIDQIEQYALHSYKKLELNGVVRFDFIKSDELYLNEINTIPGALANYLFKEKELTFGVLIDEQIKEALYQHTKRTRLINNFNSSVLQETKKIIKK